MDIEKITNFEQLSGEQKEFAEIVGLEIYKKIVCQYGGSSIYINKADTLTRSERNAEIKRKFNGSNYRELAKEYGLSEPSVRKIVNRKL